MPVIKNEKVPFKIRLCMAALQQLLSMENLGPLANLKPKIEAV